MDSDNSDNASSIPWWRGQEEVVISGISGRFPDSDTVDEFADHLYAGRDMVTEDNRRWEPGWCDFED